MRPVRIIGLLSWYEEPVEALVASLAGLKLGGVDHVVAVDGAYALFPGGRPSSDPGQHAAITMACRQLGMGLTLHTPQAAFAGNEVEKRTLLFALGWAVAEPGDWFWVQDADQVTTDAPDDLKSRLAATDRDVAEVNLVDVVLAQANRPDWPAEIPMRSLFRAQPITVRTNHSTYVTADGRLLWNTDRHGTEAEPTLDLTDCVRVEHRAQQRPADRLQAKMGYYAQRDEQGVERGFCKCGQRAVKLVACDWRMTEIGPASEWEEACADCVPKLEKRSRYALRMLGVDPDRDVAMVANHNGRIPQEV